MKTIALGFAATTATKMGEFTLQSEPPFAKEILGPYPILQFFAALIVMLCIGLAGLAWLRGEKRGREDIVKGLGKGNNEDAAVQLFFGGPLKAIFDALTDIRASIVSIQSTLANIHGKQEVHRLEYKDIIAQQLSTLRHTVMTGLQEVQAELSQELGADVENVRRDAIGKLDDLARDIKDARDRLVKLEANQPRRR